MKIITKRFILIATFLLLCSTSIIGFLVYRLETSIDKVIDKEQQKWLITELHKAELPDNFYNTIEQYYPNHFQHSAWGSVVKQLTTISFNHCRCREVYIPYLYYSNKKKEWIPFNQQAFVIARELERQSNQKQCYALNLKIALEDYNHNIKSIENASIFYFKKSLINLSDKEILTLHLIAKSPTRYNPKINPDNLRIELDKILNRRKYINTPQH